MPPAAVLVVRRLADPAPTRIGEADAAVASVQWERAVQGALSRCYRQAVRPAAGPVPASAPAVLFLDPAELLACLARDALSGVVADAWWWRAWLRATGRSTHERLLETWIREARHVPAAMAVLQTCGLASRLAGALSPREARTLFIAVTEAYDVPGLAAPAPADTPVVRRLECADDIAQDVRVSHGHRRVEDPPPRLAAEPPPPWDGLVPASSVPLGLGLEQRTLLGIALTLARAPLVARTRAFQHAFHAWRRAQHVGALRPISPDTTPEPPAMEPVSLDIASDEKPSGASEIVEPPPPRSVSADIAPAPPPQSISMPRDGVDVPERARRPDAQEPLSPRAHADLVVRRAPILEPSRVTEEAPRTPALVDASSHPDGIASPSIERRPAIAVSRNVVTKRTSPIDPIVALPAPAVESVRTGLGGVLFLINALQGLKLFDRLDDHFGVESSIGGWAWLEIVARCLLGDGRQDAALDPIWPMLAALDGRPPGAAITGTFRGLRSCRLPREWPTPDAPVPATDRPWQPLGLEPRGELRRFLDTLIPYLRWRVLNAMALNAGSAQDDDALLAGRLLYRHGRLTCTSTHVDLHMGLDHIDIAVRLAGLDANPGWVPALGRVITFYFEE
jgi:hypothetical protein